VRGFTCVIIIDVPGSLADAVLKPRRSVRCAVDQAWGGPRSGSARFVSLDATLEPGHQVGYDGRGEVDVVVIEAEDAGTCGEDLTPPVAVAERAPGLAFRERDAA
jgi:hypothetical protein